MDRTPSTAMIREAMAIEDDDDKRARVLGRAWNLRRASKLSSSWARQDLNDVGLYKIN